MVLEPVGPVEQAVRARVAVSASAVRGAVRRTMSVTGRGLLGGTRRIFPAGPDDLRTALPDYAIWGWRIWGVACLTGAPHVTLAHVVHQCHVWQQQGWAGLA
ncbi:hypothetical protein GCM10011509_29340 [Ornithinimicrobium pekingense]|uniref:Uncharacterized protein n=1 Tax=Ornithinimicrobium pekingense TaxID=384677 RepID=A0ABQ2FAX1_9MICO|nr:hypothetical protein GCM10011509_29340 [Ornithinimicrobium pekingense]